MGNATARQMRAVSLLTLRSLLRMGSVTQLTRRTGTGARGLLLTAFSQAYVLWYSYKTGYLIDKLDEPLRAPAASWLVVGLACAVGAIGSYNQTPQPGRVRGLFVNPLFDALAIRPWSIVLMVILEGTTALLGVFACTMGAFHGRPLPVLTVMMWSIAAVLAGSAVGRYVRVYVAPRRAAKVLLFGSGAVFFPGLSLIGASGLVGHRWPIPGATTVVRALVFPQGLMVLAATILCAGVAVWGIFSAERRGYDRQPLLPASNVQRAKATQTYDVRGVDSLVGGREMSRALMWFLSGFLAAINGLMFWIAYSLTSKADIGGLRQTMFAAGAFTVFATVYPVALRSALRDRAARPFLAPLPIAPRDLLAGKVARAFRMVSLSCASLGIWFFLPLPAAERLEFSARVVLVIATTLMAAASAVYVGFLTSGAGAGVSASLFRGARLEMTLVILPVAGVATAPHLVSAVISALLGALLMLAARQAALRAVRWSDDVEESERGTPIWQALMAFSMFQVVQTVTAVSASGLRLSPSWVMAISYVASTGALLAYVANTTRAVSIPSLLRPGRMVAFPVAIAGAVALAFGAQAYTRELISRGVEFPKVSFSGNAGLALMAAVVVLAPVAEEIFFRGWLQRAVALEFPAWGKTFAVVTTAFGFAAIHPPAAFVPVFGLGLLTGVLLEWSGALLPGILAHAIYNALVISWPG